MTIHLTYHGHSCFSLTYKGYTTVIDPYGLHVPGYLPLNVEADEVICSHEHSDHNCREAVTLSPPTTNRPYQLTSHVTPHDDQNGQLRGMNMIHVFQFDDIRIAHLGDLGIIPDNNLLNKLKNLDVLMIPVGGTYTINAHQAVELTKQLNPRLSIPMHYRLGDLGFEVLEPLSVFSSLCANPIFYDSDSITIDKQTPIQTAILKYRK